MLLKVLFVFFSYIIVPFLHVVTFVWEVIRSINLWYILLGVSSFEDAFGDIDLRNIPFVHEATENNNRTTRDEIIQSRADHSSLQQPLDSTSSSSSHFSRQEIPKSR